MRKTSVAVALLTLPLLGVPASAAPFPSSVPLPTDFQPEGITIGAGYTFYVGSLHDGDIYRGELRSGEGEPFIDVDGRQAVGMQADVGRDLLWVAGGATGRLYVYDLTDGTPVADVPLGPPGAFLNDVAVTPHAVYLTDTFAPVIHRVPIAEDGTLGAPTTIEVSGVASDTGGFGLNGIRAVRNGQVLVVTHTSLGILATVDPATGASHEIDLGPDALVPGTPDGLEIRGRTAWVVENFANSLAEVRLAPDLSSGRLVSRTQHPLFRVPTTVAVFGSRLALVNGRFNLGFPPPFGPGARPGTDFDVVVIPVP